MQFDLFKEVSIRYYDLRKIGDSSFPLEFLGYDKYRLIEGGAPSYLVWHLKQYEYTLAIINLYNNFVDKLYKLHLLEKIITEYPLDKQDDLRHEFTRTILSFCLYKPNEFRNRIIFCGYQLGFHVNLFQKINNINHLKKDENINFAAFEKECKRFSACCGLVESLNLIGTRNTEFTSKTDDYRNKNEHKLPPSLEMSITNLVKTKKGISDDTKMFLFNFGFILGMEVKLDENFENAVTFEFGATSPLKTENMIPILLEQGYRMKDVINKYWELVLEQFETFNQPSKEITN